MRRSALVDTLLRSDDPSIRWRVLVRVLGEDPHSREVLAVQEQIGSSRRAAALLDGRGLHAGVNPYAKWQGAHWVLTALADIGYPPGDPALRPMSDRVVEFWLSDHFYTEFEASSKSQAYRHAGVPVMEGRYRRCASQQANALYSVVQLGLEDDKTPRLVERLLHWQWPDGGWNCDKNPHADTSSFMETLWPMRALGLYGRVHNDQPSLTAAARAAQVFLARRLYRRRSTGETIHPEFLKLHYPLYWHYDILGGLKALAELGLVNDPRCADALDLLERKALPTGGWPAESRYYHVSNELELHADCVDWGGTSKRRMNEWVTTDALAILRAAGRA